MVGPTPVPAAQYATAATPRTSAETLLELQHELDVANDDHPAKRATWSPSQLGATTKAGPGPAQAAPAPADPAQGSEPGAPGAPSSAVQEEIR